jgi:hypothetical protein
MLDPVDVYITRGINEFVNPLIYLLSSLAFVWFLYGVVMFMIARINGDEDGIKTGKQHMLWGFIGLIIIFSAGSIYKFITSFFN